MTGFVVVVDRADDTLPEDFVGRVGRVVEEASYQGIGDAACDPVFIVAHAPYMGRPATRQFYWREELEPVSSGRRSK